MASIRTSRNRLLVCTALVAVGFVPLQAFADEPPAGNTGLADIIVTAQRREQNVQDVPIAVTALGAAALASNRVTTVTDLSGLAPGLQVVTAAGGSQLPAFSMRGETSYGVVPGSDKQVSIYLDGVYISSPRGSIFNIPDVSGIEVLRGPQGTLFGRNATAGAISLTTRDPNGKIGATAVFTAGNYNQFGARFTVSTPQIGPFSAYGSFSHQYKRGDVKNLGAGKIWDRTASPSEFGTKSPSPDYLGTKDSDAYFVAVKFQPVDSFKMVYKHDHDSEVNSPEATAATAFNPNYPGFGALFANHASLFTNSNKRPDAINNAFTVNSPERVFGHSVTSTWEATDNLTVKNITAWRHTYVSVGAAYDGVSGAFKLTPADNLALRNGLYLAPTQAAVATAFGLPNAAACIANPTCNGVANAAATNAANKAYPVGYDFVFAGLEPQSTSKQFSSELQMNLRTNPVTLTAGLLFFHGRDVSGSAAGLPNTVRSPVLNGVIPLGAIGRSDNEAKSYAAYAQAEFHASSKLDLILGGRVTRDDKSGSFNAGDPTKPAYVPGSANVIVPFTFKKTKPSWLVDVNYKPNNDVLLYAKASTANVSGGSASGVAFAPEDALSFEAGLKAEWFERRLRTNLSVYSVTYRYQQLSQGSACCVSFINAIGLRLNPPISGLAPLISTFVSGIGLNSDGSVDAAPVTTRGVEFEAVGSLGHGLTTGNSLSYSHTHFSYVGSALLNANRINGAGTPSEYLPSTLQPAWTASVWGAWDSKPFANGARISARVDANWHSRILDTSYPDITSAFAKPYNYAPADWLVNGRVALTDISIGRADAEVAVWGKNLTQNRDITFAGNLNQILTQANFQPARTFGVDVKIHY